MSSSIKNSAHTVHKTCIKITEWSELFGVLAHRILHLYWLPSLADPLIDALFQLIDINMGYPMERNVSNKLRVPQLTKVQFLATVSLAINNKFVLISLNLSKLVLHYIGRDALLYQNVFNCFDSIGRGALLYLNYFKVNFF